MADELPLLCCNDYPEVTELLEQVKQIPVLQEISSQLSEQVKRLQE
ncbi:hypothetical protein [Dictyobacter arantiisoli]|uniref:Uncharacterized protein n=1 Tax=Dictyobacter arantiisoli TaxID=2014874 RepID=A0A5A5TJQ0_9CHLR|nr:hypothetical protein [Dictyobacter arantiisoli]GCF11841.1 hypothetical protein KDI_54050 [Dictyobacter arantiisoli]